MKTMISKIAHVYDGRSLAAGEAFEAHDEYITALEAMGRAELAKPGQKYETRQMDAAGTPAAAAAAAVAQKRKYNTKHKAA
jgi:hypothetical protein